MKKTLNFVLGLLTVLTLVGCDPVLYTVSFESNGGTDVSSLTTEDGTNISEPTPPTKEEFTFEGWFVDSSLNVPFDFSSTITGDITLHAKWEEIPPVLFDVIFMDIDGTEYDRITVEEGTVITETIVNPTKDNVVFNGWYTEDTLTTAIDFDTVITDNMTLYAMFVDPSEARHCGDQVITNPVYTIGFATDTGQIDDNGYNQYIWKGITDFTTDNQIDSSNVCYEEANSDADYLPILEGFTEEALDLIVAPSFIYDQAIRTVAAENPDQHYLILDMVVDLPNVASAVFANEEQAFIAGVAAALQAQEAGADTVGFIGGMDFDLIQQFEAGYEVGVWAVDPTMTVLVDYAGSFTDFVIGQALAAKQYNAGAHVIYHAAGGLSQGIIHEAKYRRSNGADVWVIGNDVDQYDEGLYDASHSVILTSSLRKLDVAMYDMATMVMNETIEWGNYYIYGVEQNGVGLPEDNPNLSLTMLNQLNPYIDQVIDGTISVPTQPSRVTD